MKRMLYLLAVAAIMFALFGVTTETARATSMVYAPPMGPTFSINPGSLDFGNVVIGNTSPAQTATVTNTGDANLSIASLSTSAIFPISNDNCTGAVLAPGNSCTFQVSFSPAANNLYNSWIFINSDAPTSPDTLFVVGFGDLAFPGISLSPSVVGFGDLVIGQTSAPQTVTVISDGNTALHISSISTSAIFPVSNDNCSGSTLPIGATCTFDVAFSPAAAALYNGFVIVNSDAVWGDGALLAVGQGLTPMPGIGIDPFGLAFGQVMVGKTSAPQTVTITSTGNTDLHINSITSNATFTVVNDNCTGATLPVGSSCTFDMTFTPNAVANIMGFISVSSNAFFSPPPFTVSGEGIPPAPLVSLSSSSLSFGNQLVNTNSPAQVVTLTNTGLLDLHIGNISLSGEFNLINDQCSGMTVAPNGTCTFGVRFLPLTPGAKTGSVSIPSDAASSADTISLSGNGIAPIISLSVTSLNFGDLLVGMTSVSQSVTVTNTGDAPLHIGTLGITGDFGLTANSCNNATLAPAGTCSFSVAFQPLSVGPKAGTVSIPSDAYSGPNSVSLSGNGVSIPAGTNLLLNPGFDSFGSAPKAWNYSVLNVPLSSLADCATFISPACSLKLTPSNTTKIVTQTVSYNGTGGQGFIYGLSSSALNVATPGTYKFEIALFDRFSRVMFTQFQNFTNGTHSWETRWSTFTAPANFTKMRFRFYFQKSVGTAWFDDAFLMLWP